VNGTKTIDDSTMVEWLTIEPKIKGSNLTTALHQKRNISEFYIVQFYSQMIDEILAHT
jgi:hypothetical protein